MSTPAPTRAPKPVPVLIPPRRRLRQGAIVGTLLTTIVTMGLAGCRSHTVSGLAAITVDGQVLVTPPNGGARSAHSGDRLRTGDRVQVTAGYATVRLVPSGVLILRTGSQVVIDTTVRLISGAVLVQPMGASLQVSAQDGTLVVPSGVAQLVVGAAPAAPANLTAKVYQAMAHLDVSGNPPVPIAAPRQITLAPDTGLPAQASPLRYDDSDPWDRLYLAKAETISTQLAAAATGFSAQVPANQGRDPGFYQQLVPTLSGRSDFVSALDLVRREQPLGPAPAAKPGDYLIASVIAVRGSDGSFMTRLHDELLFSAQGAPWGFVAYDQGVTDLTGVLDDVLTALSRATVPSPGASASQIAIGPPQTVPRPTVPRTNRPTAPTTTTTPRPPSPGQPRRPTPPTTAPQPLIQLPVPALPGPLGPLVNPLLDPLLQALNNILAGRH